MAEWRSGGRGKEIYRREERVYFIHMYLNSSVDGNREGAKEEPAASTPTTVMTKRRERAITATMTKS
jgi:hypothetical protein